MLVIDFVHDQGDGATTFANPARGLGVLVHRSGGTVHDQQHQVGGGESSLRLLGDLVLEAVPRLEPPPGVHHVEGHATPLDLHGFSVAGHATLLLDDGDTFTGQTIHE